MSSYLQFRSEIIDTLFSDEYVVSKYLEVEAALARVQGKLGIIPEDAALAIANTAILSNIDIEQYNRDFEKVGFPIVGLVRQLVEKVPEGKGEYAHWGATTQDIMDTGLVLIIKEVIKIVSNRIDLLIEKLSSSAEAYKNTLMIGRSQLQHAIPITYGYKVAGWLAPLLRHKERLAQLKERILQLQFGGAVGTLASLGNEGFDVRQNLAESLGLKEPTIAWHTQRDSLVEFTSFLGLLTGSLSKIATDVLSMTQTEVGELVEQTGKEGGRSSTMPHKRNPIVTQVVLVAGKLARTKLNGIFESMVHDHERGTAIWQEEWSLIPDVCSNSVCALDSTIKLMDLLEVVEKRMNKNLGLSNSLIYAESLMMELAKSMGRQKAHDVIDEAVSLSLSGMSFIDALKKLIKFDDDFSEKTMNEIFSGKLHRDVASKITTDVLNKIN